MLSGGNIPKTTSKMTPMMVFRHVISRPADSLKRLFKGRAIAPSQPAWWVESAGVKAEQSDLSGAIKDYSRALQLINEGMSRARSGSRKRSKLLAMNKSAYADLSGVREMLGDKLKKKRLLEEALEQYRKAVQSAHEGQLSEDCIRHLEAKACHLEEIIKSEPMIEIGESIPFNEEWGPVGRIEYEEVKAAIFSRRIGDVSLDLLVKSKDEAFSKKGKDKIRTQLVETIEARFKNIDIGQVMFDVAMGGETLEIAEEEAAGRILDGIPFGHELRPLGQMHGVGPKANIRLLNLFLRGELGRCPSEAEVELLKRAIPHNQSYVLKNNICCYRNDGNYVDGGPIFQIYTEEYLKAYARLLVKLASDFRFLHGRDPVIHEIAAGDGRFARQINKRLPSHLHVHATDDSSGSKKWGISYGPYVEKMDAFESAKKADIIIGHWFPESGGGSSYELIEDLEEGRWDPEEALEDTSQPFDLRIALLLKRHPEKTLIVTGEGTAGCTESPHFWAYAQSVLRCNFLYDFPSTSRMAFSSGGDQTLITIVHA